MTTTIHLYDDGDDVLRVDEVDQAGKVVRSARGWVSALHRVVIDDTRDQANPEHRVKDDPANPLSNRRDMTAAEQKAYAQQLLDEHNPSATPAPAPAPLASF